jgi:aspartyl-tRNA(Asn)/glutamyl-tRNA(Gln) amidotransferase subunit A
MSDVISLTAAELGSAIKGGEVSSEEATTAYLDRIEAVDGEINAFLHVRRETALDQARAVDARRAAGEELGPLAGVPVAHKDVFTTKDMPTTAASRILEGWQPPYDATVTARLREAGLVILGKTNMDEFAMGSSTENSAYKVTRNPWDTDRIPGGSGGGSSAALAAFEAPLAIGTDTGGSIRQPGAVTGTVGVKPTYGGVSRYGLVAFSSSLDQPGPCARTVLDAALLHEVIAGHDPMDSTSIDQPVPQVVEAAKQGANGDLTGVKVGVVREFSGDGYQPGVQRAFDAAVAQLSKLGAEVVEVSCPHFDYALGAYYLIAPSECSSNLARFDSMRYGLRVGDDGENSAEQVMSMTREAGFGPEVKRRIMLGTYALSSGYYDAYYGQAQKVRTLITRDFTAAFEQVDVLVSPTTPTTAFKIGERVDDPMAMYLADLCTIPSNLAGNAAMSIPCGLSDEDGLPVGLQIMAPAMADDRLYRVGAAYEAARDAEQGGPLINRAPKLEAAV